MNKAKFIEYVKERYPDMIEDYWFSWGELHFYKSETHANTLSPYACIRRNGKFEILYEF